MGEVGIGGEAPMKLLQTDRSVVTLAFSPDGSLLAAGGWQYLALWDVRTGRAIVVKQKPCAYVVSAAFTPNGKGMAWIARSGGSPPWHQELRYGQVTAPRQSGRLDLQPGQDARVAALADGHMLVAVAGQATYYDPAKYRIVQRSFDPGVGRYVDLWESRSGRVPAFCDANGHLDAFGLVPEGAPLAQVSNYVLDVWAVGQKTPRLRQDQPRFYSAAFTPDGNRLLAGRTDKVVVAWDMETWTICGWLDWGIGCAECLAISPDGLTAAASGYTGEIVIWNLDL